MVIVLVVIEVVFKGGGSKKKLIIILVVVFVLVLVGGGVVLLLLKKKVVDDQVDEDGIDVVEVVKFKVYVKSDYLFIFVLFDFFIVNLVDKDVDCFVQIGVMLQVDDFKFVDQIKVYMFVVCSNVLMVLVYKMVVELLILEGKEKFVKDIMCEVVCFMGIEFDDEDEVDFDVVSVFKKKKKKKVYVESLIMQVFFFNFIVQ